MADDKNPMAEAEKAAAIYSWNYFAYHAAQRQAVFRFYVTLVGVATLAYGYSQRALNGIADQPEFIKPLIGGVYIVGSLFFCRLDQRSQQLIKNAENALKSLELSLSSTLKNESVKLMHLGEVRSQATPPLNYLSTFRQIYAAIFLCVSSVGAIMIADHFGLRGWIASLLR